MLDKSVHSADLASVHTGGGEVVHRFDGGAGRNASRMCARISLEHKDGDAARPLVDQSPLA